jgi:hypothetical protein
VEAFPAGSRSRQKICRRRHSGLLLLGTSLVTETGRTCNKCSASTRVISLRNPPGTEPVTPRRRDEALVHAWSALRSGGYDKHEMAAVDRLATELDDAALAAAVAVRRLRRRRV